MKLKVYGGHSWCKEVKGQVRVIVATKTKKKAAEVLDMSYHHFITYFGETGNEKELEVALATPEVVFAVVGNGINTKFIRTS